MWKSDVKQLEKRKKIAHHLGGKENVAKHHQEGRMTVRERIHMLVDRGSFSERGILAGVPTYDIDDKNWLIDLVPCPFVMGIAKIDGRPN